MENVIVTQMGNELGHFYNNRHTSILVVDLDNLFIFAASDHLSNSLLNVGCKTSDIYLLFMVAGIFHDNLDTGITGDRYIIFAKNFFFSSCGNSFIVGKTEF